MMDKQNSTGKWKTQAVEVEGCSIEYVIIGNGTPVIVLESGLGDTLTIWKMLIFNMDIDGTFLLYNRPGYGRSQQTDQEQTAAILSVTLHKLLMRLNLQPPWVLVAHSLGAAYAQVFAARYHDNVSAMMLIDPMCAEMDELCHQNNVREWAFTGVKRWFASLWLGKGAKKELAQREVSLEQAKSISAGKLTMPVTIITADNGMSVFSENVQQCWIQSHRKLTDTFPNCTHEVAFGSGHHVQKDMPELVSSVLKRLITSTRSCHFR